MSDRAYRGFYRDVGRHYPEADIVYQGLRGRLRAEFIQSIISMWQGSLLDIGCNTGDYLRSYTGGNRFGIDLSLELLRSLRKADPGISPVVADAEELDFFNKASFNHILCSELLEHVLHPALVMKAIQRLLKTGGTCLITTPDFRGKRPEWIETGTLEAYGIDGMKENTYFHTAFHPDELCALAEASGLMVCDSGTIEKEVKYASKLPAIPFILLRWLNQHVLCSTVLERFNQRIFDKSSVTIYNMACAFGLNKWLVSKIHSGVRSYCIAEKKR